jgi:hypothetical protein
VLPPIEHTDEALAEFTAEKKDFEVEDSITAIGASRRVLRGSAELCFAWPNYTCHHGPRGHGGTCSSAIRPYSNQQGCDEIDNRDRERIAKECFGDTPMGCDFRI